MLRILKATDNRDKGLKLNLQLFADGEPAGAEPGGQPAVEPNAQPQGDPRQSLINPLFAASSEPEPEPGIEPGIEPVIEPGQEPNEPQIPEDLKPFVKDGKLYGKFEKETDVIKAYGDLEKAFHGTNQEKAQLKQQLDNLQQLIEMQKQQTIQATPGQEPQKQESEPSIVDKLSNMSQEEAEEWMENFYEQGPKALVDIVKGINAEIESKYDVKLQEKIQEFEPIKQEFATQKKQQLISEQLRTVQENSDFDQLKPVMAQVISENQQQFDALAKAAEADPSINPYQVAYEMAKGRQPQQGPTKEQLEQELRQKLLNDSEFKKQIVQSHMESIKNQNGNLPNAVIGNQPAGSSPATPPNEIKSVSQGTKAFLSFLKGVGGN